MVRSLPAVWIGKLVAMGRRPMATYVTHTGPYGPLWAHMGFLMTHIVPIWALMGPLGHQQIRRPLVERLLEPVKGDRVYPIPLSPFPAGPLPGQMPKKHVGSRS